MIIEIEWIFQASKYLWNIYVNHIFENPIRFEYQLFEILNFEFWILLLIEIDWIFDIEFSEILKKTIFIFFSVTWYF